MNPPSVLVVDDQIGEVLWLIRFLQSRGYRVIQATNERVAQERFLAVREGRESYLLAIVDIAVATHDIEDMVRDRIEFDDNFVSKSSETGLRLCEYARKKLRLSEAEIPIVCLSIRAGEDQVKARLKALGIRAFERDSQSSDTSIRRYLEEHLPTQAPQGSG